MEEALEAPFYNSMMQRRMIRQTGLGKGPETRVDMAVTDSNVLA
jgi:hypothetical protein